MVTPFLFLIAPTLAQAPLPVSYYIGLGHNSLTNEFGLNVLNVTFKEHVLDTEQRGYIPDNTNGYSNLAVNEDFYAKMESWMSNTSETRTAHYDEKSSFFGIGSSYSRDARWTHQHLSNRHNRVATVTSKILTSTLVSQLDNSPLANGPRNQLHRIAYSIDKGTNTSYDRAVWETNQFLKMYGDEVTYKIDNGGLLQLSVAIDTRSWQDYTDQQMKQNTGLNFGKYFGLSGSYSYNYQQTSYQSYNDSVVDTNVKSKGGSPWKKGQTYNDWLNSTTTNQAVVDIYTMSIMDFIVPWRLPELNQFQVQNLREIFDTCITNFIEDNTHVGCMDPYASNFNFKANVNNEIACMHNQNFSFGGVYQESSNSKFRFVNELTGTNSCPHGFTSYQITKPHTISHSWATKHCHSCWAVATCCKHGTSSESATVTPYMCIAPINNESHVGGAFGGMFTDSQVNDVTNRYACPTGFHVRKFPLSWDIKTYYAVCYAPFDTEGANNGVKFGGIFSSNVEDINTKSSFCPEGYARHSVYIGANTYLYYCTGMNDPHERFTYIPPGWGNPEPNFVDTFPVNDTDVLLVNISDKNSYYEQYSDVYDSAHPPTPQPTHTPTTPHPTPHPTTPHPTTPHPTTPHPTPHNGTNHGYVTYKTTATVGMSLIGLFIVVILGMVIYDMCFMKKYTSYVPV